MLGKLPFRPLLHSVGIATAQASGANLLPSCACPGLREPQASRLWSQWSSGIEPLSVVVPARAEVLRSMFIGSVTSLYNWGRNAPLKGFGIDLSIDHYYS